MSAKTIGLTRRAALLAGASALAAPALASLLPSSARAAAPMMGASRPTHFRYKLGDMEITVINDGSVVVPGPHPIFGANQPAEEVQKFAQENFLPTDKMTLSFAPIIVNTGKEVVAFDTGNGIARRDKGAGKLAATLAAAGLSTDQVDIVFLSHYHPDHIGGLMEGGKPLFPNARYITGQVEYDFWSPKEKAEGPTAGVGKVVQANVVPFAEKMTFIKPGDTIVSGITAVDAMGHTPGHLAVHLESAGKRLLHMVDTCNHYIASMEKPDWHVRFDMDKEKAVGARQRLLDMAASDRILTSGYHMPFPAVGHVGKKGTGYRWMPISYQLDL